MELDGKKVNFLGDSITYGHGVADPANRFVDRLRRECGLAEATLARVTDRVLFHLSHRADGMEAGVLMFSKEYGILGQSENAPELLKKIMEE